MSRLCISARVIGRISAECRLQISDANSDNGARIHTKKTPRIVQADKPVQRLYKQAGLRQGVVRLFPTIAMCFAPRLVL
jgi:hypothetical protein